MIQLLPFIKPLVNLFRKAEYIKKLEEMVQHRIVPDPTRVINACFKNGIEWFDYKELKSEERLKYYQEAQQILRSNVFKNEKNYLIAVGSREALLGNLKPEHIRDFGMSINGMELMEQRLREIENPNKEVLKSNLHSAI